MALGDGTDFRHGERRKYHHRYIVALGRRPKPIRRAVIEPRVRAFMTKTDAKPQHAWLLCPSRPFLLRWTDRSAEHFTHDGKTVGV